MRRARSCTPLAPRPSRTSSSSSPRIRSWRGRRMPWMSCCWPCGSTRTRRRSTSTPAARCGTSSPTTRRTSLRRGRGGPRRWSSPASSGSRGTRACRTTPAGRSPGCASPAPRPRRRRAPSLGAPRAGPWPSRPSTATSRRARASAPGRRRPSLRQPAVAPPPAALRGGPSPAPLCGELVCCPGCCAVEAPPPARELALGAPAPEQGAAAHQGLRRARESLKKR
mmetsp:Transcript_1095/g.3003  ORF Transcript_1095/g.3003 Transcript_1095/m.3003 type:complete len:224 (+) Transcript_1095:143-814(+)